MAPSDAQLIERWARKRDAEAFAELVRRHAGAVYGACRRMLGDPAAAEDAAQETFIRLSRAGAEVRRSPAGWLHRVAANQCRDRLRREKRLRNREQAYADLQAGADEPDWDDVAPLVDEAVAELPGDLREAIVRHFLEGQSHGEIAAELGLSRSGVTRRIQRGIERVRRELRRKGVPLSAGGLAALLPVHAAKAAPATLVQRLGRMALSGTPPASPAPWFVLPPLGGTMMKTIAIGCVVIMAGTLGIWESGFGSRGSGFGEEVNTEEAGRIAVALNDDADAAGEKEQVADANAAAAETAEVSAEPAAADPAQEESEGWTLQCVDDAGEPVAGAEVWWYSAESARAIVGAELEIQKGGPLLTDEQGELAMPPVPGSPDQEKPSVMHVYARTPGRFAGVLARANFAGAPPMESVLTMKPAATVTGWVDAPAAVLPTQVEVSVVATMTDASNRQANFVTPGRFGGSEQVCPALTVHAGNDGSFVLADLPDGYKVKFSATGPGLAKTPGEGRIAGGTLDVGRLVLAEEGVIEGVVRVKDSREPLPDLTILARGGSRMLAGGSHAMTDASGRFRIDKLLDGVYSLHFQNETSRGTIPEGCHIYPLDVKVVAGGVATAELWAARGCRVFGTVVYQDTGEPVAAPHIVAKREGSLGMAGLFGGKADSSRPGVYELLLPEGDYTIHVYGDSNPQTIIGVDPVSQSVSIAAGQAEIGPIDFAVPRPPTQPPGGEGPVTLTGKAVDAEGNPLAGVRVWVKGYQQRPDEPEDPNVFMHNTDEVTGSDGSFSVTFSKQRHLPTPDIVSAAIGSGEWALVESARFPFEKDAHYDVGTLASFRHEHWLAFTVVDSEGNPVRGAEVLIHNSGFFMKPNSQLLTDRDGFVRLDGLPGQCYVHIQKPGTGIWDSGSLTASAIVEQQHFNTMDEVQAAMRKAFPVDRAYEVMIDEEGGALLSPLPEDGE